MIMVFLKQKNFIFTNIINNCRQQSVYVHAGSGLKKKPRL